MHRNNLKKLLQDYNPSDNDEIGAKQKMLSFLEENSNCFERSCPKGHFTASSWLLNQTGDKALLMHHAKFDKWMQLGGHCDGDSNILQVAIKEAQEESGINEIIALSDEIFDIDIHHTPATPKEQEHYHFDIRFLLQINPTSQETIIQNAESKDLKWFGEEDILPTNSRSVTRMFEKWVKGVKVTPLLQTL
ncbi:MAG: family hydrolase [Rickettsiaceae bacterium]|jgi:8-oxo-dGTP pyrophosphatase MutT (NUDIX family)|nr:family hydrolase [Rickettsiaceae bacterium]